MHSKGYGFSVLPSTRASPETLWYTGSTTKSFTAAALSLLIDDARTEASKRGHGSQGKEPSTSLTWRTPIASLIRDDFVLADDYATQHCTLEDAASHRTCMPRHEEAYGGPADTSARDVVRRLRHLPLMSVPLRSTFEYANTPWVALSLIVETLSGMSLEAFLKERIWTPLGMEQTFFGSAGVEELVKEIGLPLADLARGYFWDDRTQARYVEEPYMDLSIISGAGAIVSSVLDYAKYLSMMLDRGGPLSPTAHDELRKPHSFVHASASASAPPMFVGTDAYALGWTIQIYRGVEVIQHGGGLHGFSTYMGYVPRHSFGAVICANAGGLAWYGEQAIFFALLDDVLGVPETERFDFVEYGLNLQRIEEKSKGQVRERLFPTTPRQMKRGLPLEAYAGSYVSPGYQRLVFVIAKQTLCIPGCDLDRDVLRAESFGKLWPHAIELEHISGEHFLAWVLSRKGSAEWGGVFHVVNRGVKAEFSIGPDGVAYEVGIAMEPALGDQKIWFKREIST